MHHHACHRLTCAAKVSIALEQDCTPDECINRHSTILHLWYGCKIVYVAVSQ